MDSIAKTSLLTAALRAAESKREDRMFNDPYAELLAGAEGFALMQKGIEAAGDQPAIAIRTSYIDSKIEGALKDGVRQIVMLAAGMDTRAYRLNFPPGTTIFELDRKEVIDYKKEKLKSARLKCSHKSIAVDLRNDWKTPLTQSGFRVNVPTLWLVEGLVMYLEESQVTGLLERLKSLASPKDYLVMDILSRTLLESPHMEKQLKFLSSIGAPWKFGSNDPIAFLKKYGWKATATQAGEFAPQRWPFPVAPLDVPNVPRGFFLEARKT